MQIQKISFSGRIFSSIFFSFGTKFPINILSLIPRCTFQSGKPQKGSQNPIKLKLKKDSSITQQQTMSGAVKIMPDKTRKKFERIPENKPKSLKEIKENSLNSPSQESIQNRPIPFDEFTRQLAQEARDKSIFPQQKQDKPIEDFQKSEFPWDFDLKIKPEPEGNLKCPLPLNRLINHNTVLSLYKDFLEAIEEFDNEKLEKKLEHTFWRKIERLFTTLKDKGYRIQIEGIGEKDTKIDLFKITNYFTVGVVGNRKKNDGQNNYLIFDGLIKEIPTKNIIRKRLKGDELAVIKVNVDLMIESNIKLNVLDKERQYYLRTQEPNKSGFHHMKLEIDILQIAYSSLKMSATQLKDLNEESMGSFKYIFKPENWRIIDFDGIMEGNELIPQKVIF